MVGSTLRLRKEFTRALLAGDAEAADRVIRAAMDSGLNAAEIDIELITPALFMVGDKWATGEITVADEHLASEIALRVLALQRAVRQARRQRRNRRVLLLAPQGERHVIGLNMACDLLYAAGYDTLMLGADVPLEDIVPAAFRHAPDVIAFSATMDETNEVLDAAIDHLRTSNLDVGVLLGGKAVSFEVAATWHAAVCRDVSNVVETVDALVQHAPLN